MGTDLGEFLRSRKQRFLDTMATAWDQVVAAADYREETYVPEEVRADIRVNFRGTNFQIASIPVLPLQGDFDPLDPKHRQATPVE